MKTITLTGMMGSGKTSVAKILSKIFDCELLETDTLIEQTEQLTISEIFAQKGESYFRNLEKNIILNNTKPENQIISLGGGAFENTETREYLLQNTIVIYLKTTAREIYKRINSDTSRPLLKNNMSIEKIEQLIDTRAKNYEQAIHVITTDNKTTEEISTEIRGVL